MPEANDMVVIEWSGSDTFRLKTMEAYEYLGRPYRFEVLILSENPDVNFTQVVGKTMTITFNDREQEPHHFHGYIASFTHSEQDDETIEQEDQMYGYRAVLVPWLWLLTRTSDCLIFQEKNVPDIIEDVCKTRNGFTDIQKTLSATYNPREFCVQYRETAFDFVNRLMEQEGIFYFFTHEQNKHTMVMRDANPASGDSVGDLPYRSKDDPEAGKAEHVRAMGIDQQIRTAEYHLTDYDFEKPTADLLAKSKVTRSHEQAAFIQYDYPGLYLETADGDQYAKVNIERLQAGHEIITGTSTSPKLRAGSVFKLTDHRRSGLNRHYLITETKITVTPEWMGVEDDADVEQRSSSAYLCQFKAIELNTPYRPPLRTPWPRVQGLQTAVVVGKSGEEIWTDKYGRIKVQFHWDREGKKDEKSSCFVRVATTWAGKEWGHIKIPRMGQEVIVEFLEGNPDRPLVTGSVYNKDVMPPYALPDNQTQSGLKTRSTKGGSGDTFNELRFEDKKDEEEIYFHAEKDMTQVVENNYTRTIGVDKADPGDYTTTIENTRETTVNSGDDILTVSTGEQKIDVKTKIHIKAGDEIKLECGQSTITLKKDGTITVKGKDIKMDAMSGIEGKANSKIDLKSSGTFKAKGTTADLNGDASVTIKGGMTNIN